ncbi:hypothetical protein BKA62DRAFT_763953, partial [Auriculariales sp. MPI-PUGE-AT-0066]
MCCRCIVPSDWSLGPRTATGDIDYAAMGLPTPAPDDELSLDTLAPANLVSAGTGLGPHQPLNSPVPLYPFQGQSNSLPAISGPSMRTMRRHRTRTISQTRGSCKAWVHRAATRTGHRRQGNSLSTIRNLRHFPSGSSPSGPTRYEQLAFVERSYHTSAMAAAPPLSMGNIQGPGPMTAPSSSMAPRTGTKRWMSAEVAENGGPDLTTSKTNEGRMKRSPLGEITADAQNTMARQDLVATPRGAGSEYVRPIAGKKRPPTPTSISSLSPELVVPTAPGPANIPAPSTAGGPETTPTVAKSAQDPADGCSSGTTTSIDDASGAPNGRDVSSSLESGIGQA